MNKDNQVVLSSKDNRVELSINGVHINRISYLNVKKEPLNQAEITIKFKCNLKTKEQ